MLNIPAPYSRYHRDGINVAVVWWEEGMEGEVNTAALDVEKPEAKLVTLDPAKTSRESTPRELFGRAVQTPTEHGFTGEYYQRFVPTESPWCTCSDEVTSPILQTRQHIVCDCPRYEAYCNILRKNHPGLHAHNFSLRHLFDPRSGLPELIVIPDYDVTLRLRDFAMSSRTS